MILPILFIQSITAYNLVGYPTIDVIPPINKTMTDLLLRNVTVALSGGPIYDYSKDIINCTASNAWVIYNLFNTRQLLMMMDLVRLL